MDGDNIFNVHIHFDRLGSNFSCKMMSGTQKINMKEIQLLGESYGLGEMGWMQVKYENLIFVIKSFVIGLFWQKNVFANMRTTPHFFI